jgi:hypothetical protein
MIKYARYEIIWARINEWLEHIQETIIGKDLLQLLKNIRSIKTVINQSIFIMISLKMYSFKRNHPKYHQKQHIIASLELHEMNYIRQKTKTFYDIIFIGFNSVIVSNKFIIIRNCSESFNMSKLRRIDRKCSNRRIHSIIRPR